MKNEDLVTIGMGSGGRLSSQLIEELFLPAFNNKYLAVLNDQACLDLPIGRVAVSTDSHVVSPIFFPGGDIGSLSVNGTVNDVAMSGAVPYYLTLGLILEEGFPLDKLRKIISSIAEAVKEAKVKIITGDTKVVEKGHGDGIYVNTTGIGIIPEGVSISADKCQPGDKIILSGTIGDHGAAIISTRESLSFGSNVTSDCAALNELVADMLVASKNINCLRDPTRGGLGVTLNEIAAQSKVGMIVDETKIPIREEVKAVCEVLGLDPIYLANEGKLIAICPATEAEKILKKMKLNPKGKDAQIIGEVISDKNHIVQMKTTIGGSRLINWITSDQLPRIC